MTKKDRLAKCLIERLRIESCNAKDFMDNHSEESVTLGYFYAILKVADKELRKNGERIAARHNGRDRCYFIEKDDSNTKANICAMPEGWSWERFGVIYNQYK